MATALQHIESHWNSTVVPSILEQYKDSAKWQAMLKAVIDQMQIAEDAAAEFMTVLDFNSETPTGYRLDFIAGLVNVTRMAGETDGMFFTRFVISLGYRRAGTPDFVINSAKLLSQDAHPQYMDEAPATFFVYTPNGRQLKRASVKKMAPCGVLGLPGAAIQFADGSLMGDYDGRKMLAVADDSRIETDTVLADESYRPILDNYGTPLHAVVKGLDSNPTVHIVHGGASYNAIRIKDLPNDDGTGGFLVRDSANGGTVKSESMSANELESLWDNTEPEGD